MATGAGHTVTDCFTRGAGRSWPSSVTCFRTQFCPDCEISDFRGSWFAAEWVLDTPSSGNSAGRIGMRQVHIRLPDAQPLNAERDTS